MTGRAFWISFHTDWKNNNGFFNSQSWRVLKSWYTCEGLEQEFRGCFTGGLNQSLVSSVAQAKNRGEYEMLETGDEAQWITKTRKRRGHLPLLAILHRERERETYGNKARGLVMLHAKVGTRLVAPFKGIQLCSACECLLNPINWIDYKS